MTFGIMGGLELAALVVDLGSCMFMLSSGKRVGMRLRLCGHGLCFRSPWFVASDGAVPGAPWSLTPGVSRHGGTSKQLGRADF